MPRCPTCYRRLGVSAPCPLHGLAAVEAGEGRPEVQDEPPVIPGYKLGKRLGVGGFSLVWEASREGDQAPLAIKVGRADSPISLERFRRDAEAMERIGPPFAPKVSLLGRLDDGRPYLVMERFADRTLAEVLEILPAPPGALWAVQAGLAVATALQEAHARGIIHRDLKPENIFLSASRERATLIDFGLMRRIDAKDERFVTRDGTVVGTPEYMAPEQLRGDPGLDARADVYAFGVILFEMLTLRPPFAGDPSAIERGHLELRPPRLTEIVPAPMELEDLVLACLAKDPERRPAGASALIQALDAIGSPAAASGPLSSIMPPSAPVSAPRSSQLLAEGRQPMIVLVAETKAVAVQVLAALTGRKGVVARQSGARYVGVFSGADTDDPVHTALATARELVVKLGARVALHLAPLSMRRKLRGPPAVYGLAIDRPETWLPQAPWSGIVVTAELARAMPAADLEPCPAIPCFFAPVPVVPQFSGIGRASEVPLFGRDEILAALTSSAEQSFSAAVPGLFSVIGDHGLGKSRIAGEAVSVALRVAPRARVISLRAEQPLAGGAGQTTRELLTQLLGLHDEPLSPGPEAVSRRCAERLGDASDVWLPVAVALGCVPPQASPGTSRAVHHGAMRALAEGLLALARRGPVAVVLDDAHWADDTALDALEYATLGASGCPLWVVVTAHPRFDEARRGFGLRAHRHDRVLLEPLDEMAGVPLAAELLLPAEYPPRAALARLVAWSGGNPFCLAELVRTLKRAGIVRRAPTGAFYVATTELDHLPPSPAWQWLAVKKLDTLRPELSACVRLCSVLGEEFSRTEVEEVQDAVVRAGEAGTHIDVGVGLQALVESGIFVRGMGDRYSFQSPTFRDAVCELLDPARREAIHRVAFDVWRSRLATAAPHAAPSPAWLHGLEQLARHAGAGGLSDEAAVASFELAEIAWSKHRHVEADQRYTAALAFLSPDSPDVSNRRLRALAGRGKARYRLHRVRDALDDLRSARVIAERLGDFAMTADLLLEEATALDWAQSFEESARLAEQARSIIERLPVRRLESRLLVTLGRSRCREQRLSEAVDLLTRGALGSAEDGDQDTRVVALLMLSSVLVLEGRLEQAEATFLEVIHLCGEFDDRFHLGSALVNRALLWTARAAPDRAMEDLRRAIHISREVGNPWMERAATHNVAELLYWSGQSDEALALARRSRTLEERFVESIVPDDTLLLARIQALRGEAGEARALLAWIAERCPVDKLAPTERALAQALSMVLSEAPGEPLSDSAAWDRLVEEAQGFPPEELLEVLFLRARAAIRNGRIEEAVQCAVQSRQRLEGCPIWRPRYAALVEEIDRVLAGAGSDWSLEQAAR